MLLCANCTIFYRATLCVSAVFAVVWCPSVCLVCLSRWCIVSIYKAEDIGKLLSLPGSPIILVV